MKNASDLCVSRRQCRDTGSSIRKTQSADSNFLGSHKVRCARVKRRSRWDADKASSRGRTPFKRHFGLGRGRGRGLGTLASRDALGRTKRASALDHARQTWRKKGNTSHFSSLVGRKKTKFLVLFTPSRWLGVHGRAFKVKPFPDPFLYSLPFANTR